MGRGSNNDRPSAAMHTDNECDLAGQMSTACGATTAAGRVAFTFCQTVVLVSSPGLLLLMAELLIAIMHESSTMAFKSTITIADCVLCVAHVW